MATINPALLTLADDTLQKKSFIPSDAVMGGMAPPSQMPAGLPPPPEAGGMPMAEPGLPPPGMMPGPEGGMPATDPGGIAGIDPGMLAQVLGAGGGGEGPDVGGGREISISVDDLIKIIHAISGKGGTDEMNRHEMSRLKQENKRLKDMMGLPDPLAEPSDGGTGGMASPAGLGMGMPGPASKSAAQQRDESIVNLARKLRARS